MGQIPRSTERISSLLKIFIIIYVLLVSGALCVTLRTYEYVAVAYTNDERRI